MKVAVSNVIIFEVCGPKRRLTESDSDGEVFVEGHGLVVTALNFNRELQQFRFAWSRIDPSRCELSDDNVLTVCPRGARPFVLELHLMFGLKQGDPKPMEVWQRVVRMANSAAGFS